MSKVSPHYDDLKYPEVERTLVVGMLNYLDARDYHLLMLKATPAKGEGYPLDAAPIGYWGLLVNVPYGQELIDNFFTVYSDRFRALLSYALRGEYRFVRFDLTVRTIRSLDEMLLRKEREICGYEVASTLARHLSAKTDPAYHWATDAGNSDRFVMTEPLLDLEGPPQRIIVEFIPGTTVVQRAYHEEMPRH